jgi:hypothetical protein
MIEGKNRSQEAINGEVIEAGVESKDNFQDQRSMSLSEKQN